MSQHNSRGVSPPGDGRIAVVYRGISELKPDPSNPRRHDRDQIKKLILSIKTFGFVAPDSCSRRIAMICSSVNLDDLIVRLLLRNGLYSKLAEIQGLRSKRISLRARPLAID